jgi:hypothetical protein
MTAVTAVDDEKYAALCLKRASARREVYRELMNLQDLPRAGRPVLAGKTRIAQPGLFSFLRQFSFHVK